MGCEFLPIVKPNHFIQVSTLLVLGKEDLMANKEQKGQKEKKKKKKDKPKK